MIYILIPLYIIPIFICCIWARINKNFITSYKDIPIVITPIINWCTIWYIITNDRDIRPFLFKLITGRDVS